jgi:cytochrome c
VICSDRGYSRTHALIGILPFMILFCSLVLAACTTGQSRMIASREPVEVPGGDVARGHRLLQSYSCGACHVIPGVRGADGQLGPPLTGWADRAYIAGALPNTPDNLIRWIMDPQAIEPGTAMPDVGASEAESRDMAAFLYTIQGD